MSADSLFGEAADDLKKAKAMKKKVVKKKCEPKDYSIFDTDAPSIFDDPLNADKYLMLYYLYYYCISLLTFEILLLTPGLARYTRQ